jgi:hypothetical protein
MSYLATFISKRTSEKPKWNQQKVQSIKTEYFTRPHVRAFLFHLTYLLNNLTNEDVDSYITELKDAGESIGLKLNSVYQHIPSAVGALPVFERTHAHHPSDEKNSLRDDDATVHSFASSLSSSSYHSSRLSHYNRHHVQNASHKSQHVPSSSLSVSSSSSSYVAACTNQRLTAEEQEAVDYKKAALYQPLKIDDPQLKEIMQEIAMKSSSALNMLLIEQKRERLIHGYISLCSRVRRFHLKNKLEESETGGVTTGGLRNDTVRYRELKGLFEINYFHSSSFEQIVHPVLSPTEKHLVNKPVDRKKSLIGGPNFASKEKLGKGTVSRGHRPLQQLLQKKETGDISRRNPIILRNTGTFSFTKFACIRHDL